MKLSDYCFTEGSRVLITPVQASRFAKEVAGDFNPIHDPDAKRFCVPGDWLFALVLDRYGLNRQMLFTFKGMVGPNIALHLPESPGDAFEIRDAADRTYLKVERSGPVSKDTELIAALTRRYIEFSGHNFPHILVPLMTKHRVMINTERPLVIYESMSFSFDRLDFVDPILELKDSKLVVHGKRGDAHLSFVVKTVDEVVGTGRKTLVLSGLSELDEAKLQDLVEWFDAHRIAYLEAQA